MGQGGQRHTSRATRAWLRSLTPGVGLSAGGARRGQLKQSGVLGLGRKRALAGPDCEWERAVRGVLLGRSNREGGKGAAGRLGCLVWIRLVFPFSFLFQTHSNYLNSNTSLNSNPMHSNK